jgi:hypothetical protein
MALFSLPGHFVNFFTETGGGDFAPFETVAFSNLFLPFAAGLAQVHLNAQLPLPALQLVNLMLGQECRDLNFFGMVLLIRMLVINVESELANHLGERKVIGRVQAYLKDIRVLQLAFGARALFVSFFVHDRSFIKR